MSLGHIHSRAYLEFLQPKAEACTLAGSGTARDEESGVGKALSGLECSLLGPPDLLLLLEKYSLLCKDLHQILSTKRLLVDWHPCPLTTDSTSLRKCSSLEDLIISPRW